MVLGDKGVIFGVLEQRMADMVVGGNGLGSCVAGSHLCVDVLFGWVWSAFISSCLWVE